MTATTTIRIDHATLPDQFDRSRPNAVAENGSAKVCHGSGEIVLLRAE